MLLVQATRCVIKDTMAELLKHPTVTQTCRFETFILKAIPVESAANGHMVIWCGGQM